MYEELLEEARSKIQSFQQLTAQEYIPKMYWALRNEDSNVTPEDARDRIQKDRVGIWSKHTLLDAIPDEAKNPKKQKAGRLRQKETNSAALIAASSDNIEAILLESNGREKIHPPEDQEVIQLVTSNYEDDTNKYFSWDHIPFHRLGRRTEHRKLFVNLDYANPILEILRSTTIDDYDSSQGTNNDNI